MTFVNYLNGLPPGVVVIGDAAYRGFHPCVIVPFTGELNDREKAFNERVASLRQVVERSIGALQTKWGILQLKENRLPAKFNVTFASKCFIACCVLHNKFTNYIQRQVFVFERVFEKITLFVHELFYSDLQVM